MGGSTLSGPEPFKGGTTSQNDRTGPRPAFGDPRLHADDTLLEVELGYIWYM